MKKIITLFGIILLTQNCFTQVIKIGTEDYRSISMGVETLEVEKVLPDAVSKDKDGYYSIKYNEIILVLVEAIKEQQLEIEELKNAI